MSTEKSINEKAADLLMQVSYAVQHNRARVPGVIELEETAVALREAAAARPVPQAGADASPPRSGYVRRWSNEKGSYVYAEKEPVPQAGEVADTITTIDAILARPGLNPTLLLQRCRNIITAQAAEIERQRSHIRAQVEDMDTLAAALAAKDEEIATLKSDLKRETDRYAALVASDSDTLTVQNERIAELEAALRRVTACLDTFIRETDDPGSEALAAVHCARAARQATKKPKPARAMADVELQNDFTDHCQRWDKAVADRDGHSGSPGEWIVERLDELRTEAKRRGLALVEPPAPAGKEEKP